MTFRDGLKLNTLREANVARVGIFRNGKGDWLQAVLGELGEYANFRKKLERGDIDADQFFDEAADELADVVIYVDLLAHRLGIDLSSAVMRQFNRKSKEVGADVWIDADDWHRSTPPEHSIDSHKPISLNEGSK